MIQLANFIDISKPVFSICSKKVVVANEKDSIANCVKKMIESGYRRLPIVNKKNELAGIITTVDVLQAFASGIDLSIPISNIMVRDVVVCNKDEKLSYVLEKFKISRRGGFPVLEKRKVVGIVTEHDFIKLLYNKPIKVKVKEVMTPKPIFVRDYLSLQDVLKSLVAVKIRRLPVIDKNGKLVGIITTFDLLRYLYTNEFRAESLDEELAKTIVKEVITVGKEESIEVVIKTMVENKIGGLLVVDNEALEGIVTERDVLKIVK